MKQQKLPLKRRASLSSFGIFQRASYTLRASSLCAVLLALTSSITPAFASPYADAPDDPRLVTCSSIRTNDSIYTAIDREHGLDRDFTPENLAPVELAKVNTYFYRSITLEAMVHEPLQRLLADAEEAGVRLVMLSGYRSYIQQYFAYQNWTELYPDRAAFISALPGHSEHQLGVAVDFGTTRPYFNLAKAFAVTAEGRWLQENAADYGFTLSYPEWGAESTGYEWEPWHYRYGGAALAKGLSAQQVPVNTYLRRCELIQLMPRGSIY